MKKIDELSRNIELLNTVEWDLDPAVAVGRHLEWGAGWACDDYSVFGSGDESVYFAVSTWKENPVVVLVRRRGFEYEELAEFNLPYDLQLEFLKSTGYNKGVFKLDDNVKRWLKSSLNVIN